MPYSTLKTSAPPHKPMAQKSQPIAFPGRREAMMAPTVGKASARAASIPKDSSKRSSKEPLRNMRSSPSVADTTESAQTDHANAVVIRALIWTAAPPRPYRLQQEGAATTRRAQAASSPLPPPPDHRSRHRGLSRP